MARRIPVHGIDAPDRGPGEATEQANALGTGKGQHWKAF